MRIECTQCGGTVTIKGPESLARCHWCGALSRFSWKDGVFHHPPSISPEQVVRLFPRNSVLPPSLLWFPFRLEGPRLVKAFSQPYPALDSYEPPSGDLRPWPGSAGAGGEIVPLDRSDGRLVYHPFYAVTMGATGEGLLLDGVSGGVVGAEGTAGAPPAEEPRRVFFDSLLVAVVPSALLYLVFHRFSPVLAVLLSAPAGYFVADRLYKRRHGR